MATTSLDGTATIFSINHKTNALAKLVEIPSTSQKPAWQAKWADPRFGVLLALCSFDHSLSLYELRDDHKLELLHTYQHGASLNALDFAPWGAGLKLAVVGSDGRGAVVSREARGFTHSPFACHDHVATGVSWAPACSLQNFLAPHDNPTARLLFATSGCDAKLCVWELVKSQAGEAGEPSLVHRVENAHDGFVRDVSWSSSSTLGYHLLATAGEDRCVKLWKVYLERGAQGGLARHEELLLVAGAFPSPVWKVSWNFSGNLLAAAFTNSDGVNVVQVFSEVEKDKWEVISETKTS